jgi:CubicO group peptidase (beta-lactamase class C family)
LDGREPLDGAKRLNVRRLQSIASVRHDTRKGTNSMKIPRLMLAAALAFAAVSLLPAEGLPKAEPRQAGFSAERLQRIHTVLKDSVDRKEFAGITVAIARRGKLAYSESFGFLDLEEKKPMRPDTIFRIFSMTKPITSTAVMMLYEEGKFLLDDPVSKYAPAFGGLKVLAREGGNSNDVVDLNRPLTIHHLLTHTSGLFNSRGYQEANVFGPRDTLAEMAARLATVPLAHQPGEAWRYGQSLDLLAYLVEVWSGKSYDAFLRERIFEPLAMNDTGYFVPAGKLDRVAKTYALNEQDVVEPSERQGDASRQPTYFPGGSGLLSTAGDYLRFCQMLVNGGELDGKRLLSEATVEFMFRNHLPREIIPPDGPNGRRGYGFGIGGAVLMDAAASEVLSVEGELSWGGAAGTYFWIDRKNELAGVWMVQRPPFIHQPSKRFKVLTYQALEH